MNAAHWIIFLIAGGIVHPLIVRGVFREAAEPAPASAQRTLKSIIIVAALLRLPLLFMEPALSDDVWRNLWDGRVQVAGENPYVHGPLDPALSHLQDNVVWPRINHPQYRTIYPPLGQMGSVLAASLSAATGIPPLFSWKLLVVLIELSGMTMLGRALASRGNPASLAIWAWSPLAVFEFSGGGHIDGIALGLSGAAASLWLDGRYSGAGALFGGAVMTKFLPLPAAVGFFRRKGSGRAVLSTLGVIVLLSLPYVAAGPLMVQQLGVYTGNWEFNGVLSRWLRIDSIGFAIARLTGPAIIPAGMEKGIGRVLAGLLVLTGGLIASFRGSEPFLVARRTLALFLAIQPTIYPWYLANLLPFLCLSPSWSVAAWLALSPLSYEVLIGQAASGVWQENRFLQGAVFGLASVLFLIEYLIGRRRHV